MEFNANTYYDLCSLNELQKHIILTNSKSNDKKQLYINTLEIDLSDIDSPNIDSPDIDSPDIDSLINSPIFCQNSSILSPTRRKKIIKFKIKIVSKQLIILNKKIENLYNETCDKQEQYSNASNTSNLLTQELQKLKKKYDNKYNQIDSVINELNIFIININEDLATLYINYDKKLKIKQLLQKKMIHYMAKYNNLNNI